VPRSNVRSACRANAGRCEARSPIQISNSPRLRLPASRQAARPAGFARFRARQRAAACSLRARQRAAACPLRAGQRAAGLPASRPRHDSSPVFLMSAPGEPSSRSPKSCSHEGSGAPGNAGACDRSLSGRRDRPRHRAKASPHLLRSRRGASRRSTCGDLKAPWAGLPGSDGARYQAPYPERWPPLVRRRRVQPIAPWSCGQPVIMPAVGWPGPPERRLCVSLPAGAASTGAGCPASTRWKREAESPASRSTAAPPS
jgi:hypothetical protein